MSYGEGSITEVLTKDGKSYNPRRWRVCVSFQKKPGSKETRGKKIQKIVRGPKKAAIEYRDEVKATHDAYGNPLDSFQQTINELAEQPKEGITLTEMVEIWNKARITAGNASERTIKEDRKRLAQVEEYLGNQELSGITPQMVEETYAAIRANRNLSGTSMNHIHTLLKNVFRKAVDYGYCATNPCNRVSTPKRSDPQRRSLSEEESIRLLETIDAAEEAEYAKMADKEERREYREEHGTARNRSALRGIHHVSNIIAVRLGLATGMRRGEVVGLIWKNVNLERQTIRVCQSATYKGTIKSPKTQAGIRTLAIDDVTAEHLAYWKVRQAKELAKLGIKVNQDTPVCCTDVGTMLRVDNFEAWWNSWRKKNGFPTLKFHELRHTQATMLLANGVDVKTVQTRLGHANASITLGWYAHAIPENDHEAAQMLGNLLNKKAPKTQVEAYPQVDAQMSPNMSPISDESEVSANFPERMSPKCPRNEGFKIIKKQAS